MILLGAGASRDARLPIAADLTSRLLTQLNGTSPNDQRRRIHPSEGVQASENEFAQALNTVVAALTLDAIQNGAKPGFVPDVETVVSTVRMLAERRDLEVHPFVQSWASWIESAEVFEPAANWFDADRVAKSFGSPWFGRDLHEYVTKATTKQFGDTFAMLAKELQERVVTELTLKVEADIEYLACVLRSASNQEAVIATLNYDLGIERAALDNSISVNRLIDSWHATGDLDWSTPGVPLIKLHGSIDWQQDGDVVMPRQDVVKFEPALIFGKRGKLRASGPFLQLLEGFRSRLNETDRLLVIGYGFADENINVLIERWLRRDERNQMLVVDPGVSPDIWQRRYPNVGLEPIAPHHDLQRNFGRLPPAEPYDYARAAYIDNWRRPQVEFACETAKQFSTRLTERTVDEVFADFGLPKRDLSGREQIDEWYQHRQWATEGHMPEEVRKAIDPAQIDELVRSNQIVEVPFEGLQPRPDFQFTIDGKAQPIVTSLIECWSVTSNQSWDFIEWFYTPNQQLGDQLPVNLLVSATGTVLALSEQDQEKSECEPTEPDPGALYDSTDETAWRRVQARRLWRAAVTAPPVTLRSA